MADAEEGATPAARAPAKKTPAKKVAAKKAARVAAKAPTKAQLAKAARVAKANCRHRTLKRVDDVVIYHSRKMMVTAIVCTDVCRQVVNLEIPTAAERQRRGRTARSAAKKVAAAKLAANKAAPGKPAAEQP